MISDILDEISNFQDIILDCEVEILKREKLIAEIVSGVRPNEKKKELKTTYGLRINFSEEVRKAVDSFGENTFSPSQIKQILRDKFPFLKREKIEMAYNNLKLLRMEGKIERISTGVFKRKPNVHNQ